MNIQHKLFSNIAKLFFAFILIQSFLPGCKEEDPKDTTPPGVVTNVKYTATPGGAILTFKAPNDNDLLFVKASYTNSLGREVFKVTSIYSDSIEIDGFNEETPKQVKLYAVDKNNNQSEPVVIDVTPLKSYIYTVLESLEMKADLGGVRVKWINPMSKTVFVNVFYNNGGKVSQRILSSSLDTTNTMIRGIDPELYNFSVVVEDFNGNKTNKREVGSYKPLLEQKIDKKSWTILQNLSVDGDKWEGKLVNFFDDVVDTKEVNVDNSYFIISRDDNGGMLKWPLDIVIDLNKTVIINRFVVWQRAFAYLNAEQNGVSLEYLYYKPENMKSFNVSVSNDKAIWIPLGTFDIGDPLDANGNIPATKIKEAIDGHEFNLENVSMPFRYFKFSILSNYGSESDVYGSEITLYGLDNQ
ncbi:MAG: DUF4959 domain-containing protein [Paludibacter sp.]|nr:DUF4959 domain-containing protein [Paludibacter sp.]